MSIESGPREMSVEREKCQKSQPPPDNEHVRSQAALEECRAIFHTVHKDRQKWLAWGQRAMVALPKVRYEYDDLSGV